MKEFGRGGHWILQTWQAEGKVSCARSSHRHHFYEVEAGVEETSRFHDEALVKVISKDPLRPVFLAIGP